ncbi:TerC family protein [bacterium]|nr:TerC family protein [bacterium]
MNTIDTTQGLILFPFDQYWHLYGMFLFVILGVLLLDLGVFHKKSHEVTFSEALGWSVIWILFSLGINAVLYFYAQSEFQNNPALAGLDHQALAKQTALEFLTGYIVELSLSVDNIFVFVVILNYFAVPKHLQHRVLFFGILGAIIFRLLFVVLGSYLMQFHWVEIVFGALLIVTGIKVMRSGDEPMNPDRNIVLKLVRKFLPVARDFHGSKFIVRDDGRVRATPLFVCLIFLEFSDIVFAIDSVPAIFAITREPLIVFSSNICAILGLRSMYFLLAGVVDKFHFLKYGLGIVLMFVGLKMTFLHDYFGGKFPIQWSLSFIALTIGSSILLSFIFPANKKH